MGKKEAVDLTEEGVQHAPIFDLRLFPNGLEYSDSLPCAPLFFCCIVGIVEDTEIHDHSLRCVDLFMRSPKLFFCMEEVTGSWVVQNDPTSA